MKRTPILLLILSMSGTLEAAEPLNVMSFNLRGDFDEGVATDRPNAWLSLSGDSRREVALGLLRGAAPDLLGVQEAYANQVREVDEALPEHAVYAVGRDDGKRAGEHCAIYYRRDRFERLDAGTFWLSNEPATPSTYPGAACPRIASWVRLRDRRHDDASLLVLNTHWDHVSQEACLHSGRMINERLPELASEAALIVLGDLNAVERSEPFRVLIGDGPRRLLDSYRALFPEPSGRERTGHGFRGLEEGWRIDYVLHNNRLEASEAAIVRDAPGGVFPSDHYPVTAVLRYREP
ncbi:Endonuclease/Exonuclease/phosphatase family protein [Planctomycetes bacterium MalM25]|nr:Endonuclease/Exonuclease/phosphatase family protein [Planctomycetes bacterium MalM25]